jgi:hypothetical protein
MMASQLQQQPKLWIALDAPLRLQGCWMQRQQQQQQHQIIPPALLPRLVARLLPTLVRQQHQQQHQLTPPLLSMLLSLSKVARVYGLVRPANAIAILTAVLAALERCSSSAEFAEGANDASSSNSSSSSSSSPQLWQCAVMAHWLHTLAETLSKANQLHIHAAALEQAFKAAGIPAASSSSRVAVSGVPALPAMPQHDSRACCDVIAALVCCLVSSAFAGIDSASQRQLKQLSKALTAAEAIEPAVQGINALQAGHAPGPQMQQWIQLLQQFAAAAAVPLAAACNNPSCNVLDGLSEAALVKGRRCSRCKAGYRSDGCQAAHWKQHKKACKLLAAAGARACVLE